MNRLSSDGGPLILVDYKNLADSQGIENSDYDRACAVDDRAGVIIVSNSQALVLGDEPCQSALFLSKEFGPLIVRWQWAESENSVQHNIECLTAGDFQNPVEQIEYKVNDESLLLFDSVLQGNAADGIGLELPVATYIVTTICYVPDDETSLILHRFTPKI